MFLNHQDVVCGFVEHFDEVVEFASGSYVWLDVVVSEFGRVKEVKFLVQTAYVGGDGRDVSF